MNFKETRFAYRHIPTGKWVYLETFEQNFRVYLHFVDEFISECVYSAKNVIEEDLMHSSYNGKGYYGRLHPEEFELLEIEVTYEIKNHAKK